MKNEGEIINKENTLKKKGLRAINSSFLKRAKKTAQPLIVGPHNNKKSKEIDLLTKYSNTLYRGGCSSWKTSLTKAGEGTKVQGTGDRGKEDSEKREGFSNFPLFFFWYFLTKQIF